MVEKLEEEAEHAGHHHGHAHWTLRRSTPGLSPGVFRLLVLSGNRHPVVRALVEKPVRIATPFARRLVATQ